MKCKLCLKEATLLKKSHIIPNFLIKDVVDDKHRLALLTASNGQLKDQIIQSSYWEGNILCKRCENTILSRLERYFERHFYTEIIRKLKDKNVPNNEVLPLRISANRNIIKLFLLSILWRCNISKNLSKEVQLGPHKEIIRKMILENDPKTYYSYPYAVFTFINKNSYSNSGSYAKIGISPRRLKNEHGYQYSILCPGFFFHIYISSHNLPNYIDDINIDPNIVLVGVTLDDVNKKLVNSILNANLF